MWIGFRIRILRFFKDTSSKSNNKYFIPFQIPGQEWEIKWMNFFFVFFCLLGWKAELAVDPTFGLIHMYIFYTGSADLVPSLRLYRTQLRLGRNLNESLFSYLSRISRSLVLISVQFRRCYPIKFKIVSEFGTENNFAGRIYTNFAKFCLKNS